MAKVGEGKFKYEVDQNWLRYKPKFWELGQIADVALDSKDRVWLFSRSKHPITCWEKDGKFIGSWGNLGLDKDEFRVPHGMYIDSDDSIWLADHQTHLVTKHNENGDILLSLGTFGYANITITTSGAQGMPFNMPTGIAINSKKKIFVSDGYANRRMHRFSKEGKLELSWGSAGTKEGQFAILHKVGVDKNDLVYVCDRENNRIQIFSPDGDYINSWNGFAGPGDIFFSKNEDVVYVLEQGGGENKNGISILNLQGDIITRWRGVDTACQSAHGMWVDDDENIYVAEIGERGSGQRLTKFSKI
tara:strand:- start:52 stop:960 length:909 start_codon:yes stop_codon:yes gene_type:complete